MFFGHNYLNKFFLICLFFLISNCQLNTKNHGILFLENRYEMLVINKTNSNDVIRIIGNPHTKSVKNENTWIYIERVLTKGKYHQLGKNVVKENNVLVLKFDRFGVLIEKKFFDKEKMANIKFTKKVTENNLSQKSFVEEFLQSIKQKMYGKTQ